MAVRSTSFTPNRMLQGLCVGLVAGGTGLNLLIGRGLMQSIVLGAWIGTVAAAVCLVAFVFYVGLAVLDVV